MLELLGCIDSTLILNLNNSWKLFVLKRLTAFGTLSAEAQSISGTSIFFRKNKKRKQSSMTFSSPSLGLLPPPQFITLTCNFDQFLASFHVFFCAVCGQFSRGIWAMVACVKPDSFDTLHSYANTFKMPFVTPCFPENVSIP